MMAPVSSNATDVVAPAQPTTTRDRMQAVTIEPRLTTRQRMEAQATSNSQPSPLAVASDTGTPTDATTVNIFGEPSTIDEIDRVVTNAVTGIIKFTKDAFVGTINMLLGSSGGAPIPLVTEEERDAMRAAGFGGQLETPEEIAQQRTGAALAASIVAPTIAAPLIAATGTATAATIAATQSTPLVGLALTLSKIPSTLVARTAQGVSMGVGFGAVRERHEGESLVDAIVTDALIFGGFSLAGQLLAPMAKAAFPPLSLEGDAVVSRILREERVTSAVEYGTGIAEEARSISSLLSAKGIAGVIDAEIGPVTMANRAASIGIVRQWLGSPSNWGKVGGPVGDGLGRIVGNAIERSDLATRLTQEWAETITVAREALHARQAFPKSKAALRDELTLGKMLDNIYQPEDLLPGTPDRFREAFTVMRNKFESDRSALRVLTGAEADWGINAYMNHVFVGEMAIKDAATGGIRAIVPLNRVKQAAADLIVENPNLKLRVEPKTWTFPEELAGAPLTKTQFRRFAQNAADALTLTPEEVSEVLLSSGAAKLTGKKHFSNMLERSANLEGFEANPFTAAQIYSSGFSRKVAFHDFRQKAEAVLEALEGMPAVARSDVNVGKVYLDRVLGVPSQGELAVRSTVEAIADAAGRMAPENLRFPVQTFIEKNADPVRMLRNLSKYESYARLGYSPTAWFVNMTQTIVNTVPEVGIGPTMRAVNLLADKSQRQEVDALLRGMGIELAMPLSMGDQISFRAMREMSPINALYLFNKVEIGNRSVAGLARYQQALLEGAAPETALKLARQTIQKTQFNYSMADTPRLMQGPLGATAFQFKKFLTKELEFLAGLPPAKMAKFAISVQAVGGLSAFMNLPPGMLLDWVAAKMSGESITDRVQSAFPRASRGIPGMAGVDFSGSVSVGIPRDAGDVLGPGMTDIWTLVVDLLTPAMMDLIQERQGNLSLSERARVFRQLEPVVVKRMLDSYALATSGAVRQGGTGALQFIPSNPEIEEALTLVGFRSVERAEESRINFRHNEVARELSNIERSWTQRVVRALLDDAGDTERALAIVAEASSRGVILSKSQIQSAYRNAVLPRSVTGALRAQPEIRIEFLEELPETVRRDGRVVFEP